MKHKILVIDDNKDILHILEHILLESGHLPLCFSTIEIVDDIPEINPSMIFLDVKLLDADGFSVCTKLKSDPKTAHIPVILVSAVDKLSAIAKDCGADGFLSKPFDITKVESLINDHLLPLPGAVL